MPCFVGANGVDLSISALQFCIRDSPRKAAELFRRQPKGYDTTSQVEKTDDVRSNITAALKLQTDVEQIYRRGTGLPLIV